MARARHYIIPFALFILLTELARHVPEKAHLIYVFKTLLVGSLLFFWRRLYLEIWHQTSFKHLLLGLGAGAFVLICWIEAEGVFPTLGSGQGFSPFSFGLGLKTSLLLAGVRLLGAALVVPVMEELFWRSFFMRYLIRKDFQKVPLGTYRPFSFWAVVFLFSLEHYRFFPALLAGAVYGGLLCYTKNLRVSIASHAATNLGLGIYVLATQQWGFW